MQDGDEFMEVPDDIPLLALLLMFVVSELVIGVTHGLRAFKKLFS